MPAGPVLSLSNAFVAVAGGEVQYVGQFEDAAIEILCDLGHADYESYDGRRKLLWPAMAKPSKFSVAASIAGGWKRP